jgi:tetratricopeptide (TPR) repeat protein
MGNIFPDLLNNRYLTGIIFLLLCCLSNHSLLAQNNQLSAQLQFTCEGLIDTAEINQKNRDAQVVFNINPQQAYKEYIALEQYVNLVIQYCKTLNSDKKKGYLIALAMLKDEIGFYHSNIGNVTKALDYYIVSLWIYERLAYLKGIANQLNNIGYIFQNYLSDFKRAKQHYERAFYISMMEDEYTQAANALHNLGSILVMTGANDSAKMAFKKSIFLRNKVGEKEKNAVSFNYLASIESNSSLSKSHLYSSIEISKQNDQSQFLSNAYTLLGQIHFRDNNLDSALHYGILAMELAKAKNFPFFIRNAANLLSRLYEKQLDWQMAYRYRELAMIIQDSIEGESTKGQLLKQQILYEFEKDRIQDSIQREAQRLEKELMIKVQEGKISRNTRLRNSAFALILLSAFAGAVFINRKQLVKQKKEKDIMLQNLSVEQKLLRLQMNPHFIFNALNSIQSFILENETENAKVYLHRFSKLLQSVINQTDKQFITLHEELATLSLYVELEQLRFDYKFEFEVKVDELMDSKVLMIPPLVIQPFVENAIVHGIRNKKGKGFIKLQINANKDLLICQIDDDGIGRKKAAELMSNSGKVHQSLALDLLNKRLEYLQEKTLKIGYYIQDINPENINNPGTRVIINLPKIYRNND